MTKDQIKIWFWNKFYSCYPVEHQKYTGNIIMMYDEVWLRDMKLSNILNEKVKYPDKVTGQWLFHLNFKYGYFEVNYRFIWSFLEQNYSTSYIEIKNLIQGWLNKHDKMMPLIPIKTNIGDGYQLKEHDKMKPLTPLRNRNRNTTLNKHDKMIPLIINDENI